MGGLASSGGSMFKIAPAARDTLNRISLDPASQFFLGLARAAQCGLVWREARSSRRSLLAALGAMLDRCSRGRAAEAASKCE